MSYLKLRKLKEEYDKLNAMQNEPVYDDDWDEDRFEELDQLQTDLGMDFDKAINHCDVLVPESEWEEYCQDQAEDIGFIQRGCRLVDYVNWDDWAEAMKSDYKEIDFDSETYYWKS